MTLGKYSLGVSAIVREWNIFGSVTIARWFANIFHLILFKLYEVDICPTLQIRKLKLREEEPKVPLNVSVDLKVDLLEACSFLFPHPVASQGNGGWVGEMVLRC